MMPNNRYKAPIMDPNAIQKMADEELEGILMELVDQCSDETSAPTSEERAESLRYAIAEIKAWFRRHQ